MADKLDQFIPEWWAAEILSAKENSLVYTSLANRNYEGRIKKSGDRVRISQIGDITINDYTKNDFATGLTIEYLQEGQTWLDIDQAKSFSFYVEDMDVAQSAVSFVTEATGRAAYKLADTQDAYLAGLYAQCGINQNTNASPVDMTSTNIEEQFLAVLEALREANGGQQFYAVIPPWVETKLVHTKLLTDTNNSETFKNGFVGRAFGFDMYMSNNVSKNSTSWDKTRIICGVADESFTFAEQIVKVKNQELVTEGFGNLFKGLHVYGAKIIRPDVTACLFADKTAES